MNPVERTLAKARLFHGSLGRVRMSIGRVHSQMGGMQTMQGSSGM